MEQRTKLAAELGIADILFEMAESYRDCAKLGCLTDDMRVKAYAAMVHMAYDLAQLNGLKVPVAFRQEAEANTPKPRATPPVPKPAPENLCKNEASLHIKQKGEV